MSKPYIDFLWRAWELRRAGTYAPGLRAFGGTVREYRCSPEHADFREACEEHPEDPFVDPTAIVLSRALSDNPPPSRWPRKGKR